MIAAYAAIGLSISYKLIPIICLPFLLLSELNAERRWTRLMTAVTVLFMMAVLPFLVEYVLYGPGALTMFRYHADAASKSNRCSVRSCDSQQLM